MKKQRKLKFRFKFTRTKKQIIAAVIAILLVAVFVLSSILPVLY